MEAQQRTLNNTKQQRGELVVKSTKIWKSSLSRRFKLCLFAATVESVLLYINGCEARTVAPKTEKEPNGCYMDAKKWKQNMTIQLLQPAKDKPKHT